jgi:hypothetical protein
MLLSPRDLWFVTQKYLSTQLPLLQEAPSLRTTTQNRAHMISPVLQVLQLHGAITYCAWVEQLHTAQYVTLQIEIGWRKAKICRFGSTKWYWPNVFHSLLRLVNGTVKPNTVPAREECNKYDRTAAPCFWLVCYWQSLSLCTVPIFVLWVGLEKSKLLNLDVRNIFGWSHIEHLLKMLW